MFSFTFVSPLVLKITLCHPCLRKNYYYTLIKTRTHLSIVDELLPGHIDELQVTLLIVNILRECLLVLNLLPQGVQILRDVLLSLLELSLGCVDPARERVLLKLVLVQIIQAVVLLGLALMGLVADHVVAGLEVVDDVVELGAVSVAETGAVLVQEACGFFHVLDYWGLLLHNVLMKRLEKFRYKI